MQIIDKIANGGKWVWGTLLVFALAAVASGVLVNKTAVLRYERDVNRMVFNDNLGVLEEAKAKLGTTTDSLNRLVSETRAVAPDQGYIVVSIAENKLWFKRGNEVLYQTQVATGSGKTLVSAAGGKQYKFETPRGRLTVQEKEIDPAWVPPDWHFQEQANKRGLGLARMSRSTVIPAEGGSVVAVSGAEIVKRYPD
ncbi:MAG: L,D-transpeptidase, partial [Gemmatimonadaceae bacterium]